MTKYVNAAARLMDTYREGMVAIHRVKAGGRQTVTVQHVHVSDGGRAVIGAVRPSGTKRRKVYAKDGLSR